LFEASKLQLPISYKQQDQFQWNSCHSRHVWKRL